LQPVLATAGVAEPSFSRERYPLNVSGIGLGSVGVTIQLDSTTEGLSVTLAAAGMKISPG
jgi:hypothetical protein